MSSSDDAQKIVLVHAVEGENSVAMSTRNGKVVADDSELVLYDGDAESGDEIEITVESLSSSALTQVDTDATVTDDPENDIDQHEHDDPDQDPTSTRRSRVRFRSRVRIASGLHHRHRRRLSAASSLSSSPSSSVSAPLRSPPTVENCTPGWGTLGTRVSLFAYSNRQTKQQKRGRRGVADIADVASENTPLLGAGAPPAYDDSDAYLGSDDGSADAEEAALSRQIDAVFGKWPGRLLNRQWWWWQLQPIICCGSDDEP